jgi:hypothetical protein
MPSAVRRSGLVRMNQFEALATWDNALGDSIVVTFQDNLLSPEKRSELSRFRSLDRPLVLRVPGHQERKANVVGYDLSTCAFYLAWL